MAGAKKKVEAVAVVATPIRKELVLEGDPEQQLLFAHKAASSLMSWVRQKKNPVMIRGEQFLEFGDWQILGRFYGATVGVDWTKALTNGWEARSVVYRNGEIISSAEAMCTRAEKRWLTADEYAIRSMAQTRASAKALRQAFGWVAELAGMRSTPAEEMDGYDKSPVPADAVPTVTYDEESQPTIPNAKAQRARIRDLLKERGVDVSDGKACKQYVADETQLDLVEANFPKIIELLENNK